MSEVSRTCLSAKYGSSVAVMSCKFDLIDGSTSSVGIGGHRDAMIVLFGQQEIWQWERLSIGRMFVKGKKSGMKGKRPHQNI